MCVIGADPVSLGLMAAGTAASPWGEQLGSNFRNSLGLDSAKDRRKQKLEDRDYEDRQTEGRRAHELAMADKGVFDQTGIDDDYSSASRPAWGSRPRRSRNRRLLVGSRGRGKQRSRNRSLLVDSTEA